MNGSSPAKDALEAGLRIGFGRPATQGVREGDSVLVALENATGTMPRVRLREATPPPDPPAETAGRYHIEGEMARGGVGAVMKGRDLDLGREVAMKVLLEDHASNPVLVHRFVEEAQIGGQLQHPGIVPVYELGLRPDRRPFFTMKMVKGRTFAEVLEARADPAADRSHCLTVFEQVCRTLAYAHARGVVHRDLKPSNIMVGSFGEVLVMDWGLAKVLGRGGVADEACKDTRPGVETVRTQRPGTQSLAGSVLGTPAYMPPEQARGDVEHLDERADVFALGAILCEILTGVPPYTGKTAEEVRAQAAEARLEGTIERLEACGADPELRAMARACLAPRRSQRPRNAEVVADRLAAHLASVEDRARTADLATAAARARAVEEERARNLAQRLVSAERRRRRLTLGLAAVVLAVVLAAGGGFLWNERNRRDRVARQSGLVQEALAEASRHKSRAREGDASGWPRALAAAERAVHLTRGNEVEATETARAEAWLEEIRSEVEGLEQRRRETRLLERLEAIRGRDPEQSESRQKVADYAAAFCDFGLDLESLAAEEAGRRIRETSIAVEVAAVLDDWAKERARLKKQEGVPFKKLGQVAVAADPDPFRQALRKAWYKRSVKEVKRLLASARVDTLPAATILLVAPFHRGVGNLKAEADLLRGGALRFPGDFWIHYQLTATFLWNLRFRSPQEAAAHAAAAVALRPKSAAARDRLGLALAAVGDWDNAVAAHREAIRFQSDPVFFINLGKTLFEMGDAKGAEAAARKALSLDAGRVLAHSNLAMALAKQGRLDEALESHRKAAQFARTRGNNPQPLLNYGAFLCDRLGKADEAIEQFQYVADKWPENHEAWHNLGVARRRKGDVEGAIQAYRKMIDLCPESPDGYVSLSGIYIDDKRDYAKGLDLLDQALARDPENAAAHHNRGVALFSQGKVDDAIAATRRVIELNPRHARARHFLSIELREKQDWKGAVQALREADRVRPGRFDTLNDLGMLLCDRISDYAAAIRVFRRLVRLEAGKNNPLAWSNLGITLRNRGFQTRNPADMVAAVKAFRKAVALRPGNARFLCQFGEGLEAAGELEEAERAYRKAAARQPKWAWPRLRLGNLRLRQRDFSGAQEEYGEAVRLEPENPDAHYGLGLALVHDGKLEPALASFRETVRFRPNHVGAHYEIGVTLEQMHDPDGALDAYRKAVKHGPRYYSVLLNLGKLLCDHKEEYLEAEAVFERAAKLQPCDAQVHFNLGITRRNMGDPEAAAESFSRSVALKPDYAVGHLELGFALRRCGRLSKAMNAFREVLRLAPDHAPAQNHLGDLLLEIGDHEAAESHLKKVVEAHPDNAGFRFNLGNLHYHRGAFDEAVAALEKALEIRPDNTRARCCLETCRKLMALQGRLDAVVRGEAAPTKAQDLADLAWLAFLKRRYAVAARLSEAAFAADESGKAEDHFRFDAALAAARADIDAPRFRNLALVWLRAELEHQAEHMVDKSPESRRQVRYVLERLRLHRGFDAVRDAEALGKLPGEARKAWQAFWTEVKKVLARTE